jgi:protein SCO1/2
MNRVLAMALCLALACSALSGDAANEARSLFSLETSWIDDAGQPRRLSDFGGEVQVVVLFYTLCPGTCPMTVKALQILSRSEKYAIGSATRFVLVSVDPDRDSPEVLHDYRRTMQLGKQRWRLLRGPASDVRKLAALLGFNYEQIESGEFEHSNLVTVLNSRGEIVHQQKGAGGDLAELAAAIRAARIDTVPGKGSRG